MPEDVQFRRGTLDDSYKVFTLFEQALADLTHRLGISIQEGPIDPDHLGQMWAERRSLYEHLARTADQFWIAEQAGLIVGFARSILREKVRQLTELFVLPDIQSSGVGRALLELAFPVEKVERRALIATTDTRALALYLKAGLSAYFPILYFERTPEKVILNTDLAFEPLETSQASLDSLAEIDQQILGFRRDVDHQWLLADRRGYLIRREGKLLGYGYTGLRSGPLALLEPQEFPVVLAFVERELAGFGQGYFGMEVPLINKVVVEYLLGRGFRTDGFVALQMSDQPLGSLERYILTSPPFFL